jgi:hypothetical protein
MLIRIILFSILFVYINGQLNLCIDRNATSKPVIDYCISQNGVLESRCCYTMNTRIILAIDLTEMNLNKVPDLMEYINLTVIDLRLNPNLKSSETDDFLGLKSLDYLLLPQQYQCPGDKRVWTIVDHIDDPKGVVCQHQRDFCTNSTDMCIQSSSYCAVNGPNHFLCLCKEGYYGYKCLRIGKFPAGKFLSITIVITTVLSGFFYMTHRRHVKKD